MRKADLPRESAAAAQASGMLLDWRARASGAVLPSASPGALAELMDQVEKEACARPMGVHFAIQADGEFREAYATGAFAPSVGAARVAQLMDPALARLTLCGALPADAEGPGGLRPAHFAVIWSCPLWLAAVARMDPREIGAEREPSECSGLGGPLGMAAAMGREALIQACRAGLGDEGYLAAASLAREAIEAGAAGHSEAAIRAKRRLKECRLEIELELLGRSAPDPRKSGPGRPRV